MPARLRALCEALKHYGIQGVTRTKGSHHIFHNPSGKGRPYPIPAHNGLRTEIPDEYIRGLCRAFGIDYEELRKRLH
jgi:predicted RNA binding protein YcfA (HicA-like mRNA interferase family)